MSEGSEADGVSQRICEAVKLGKTYGGGGRERVVGTLRSGRSRLWDAPTAVGVAVAKMAVPDV